MGARPDHGGVPTDGRDADRAIKFTVGLLGRIGKSPSRCLQPYGRNASSEIAQIESILPQPALRLAGLSTTEHDEYDELELSLAEC